MYLYMYMKYLDNKKFWISSLQFKSIFNKVMYVWRNFTPWKSIKKLQQTRFTSQTDYKFVGWGGVGSVKVDAV